jgi:hypothetical protein
VKIEKLILKIFGLLSIAITFQFRRNNKKSQKYEEILFILSIWKKKMRKIKKKQRSNPSPRLIPQNVFKLRKKSHSNNSFEGASPCYFVESPKYCYIFSTEGHF